jgi:hypothetical protein
VPEIATRRKRSGGQRVERGGWSRLPGSRLRESGRSREIAAGAVRIRRALCYRRRRFIGDLVGLVGAAIRVPRGRDGAAIGGDSIFMSATLPAPADLGPVTAPSSPGIARKMHRWSELAAHREASGKSQAYRRFLVDFGFDPDDSPVRGLVDRPSLLFAEQPGCWYTPRDLVRAHLLERLIQRGRFDPELSGIRTLSHDRFTAIGEKGVFLDFALHPRLGVARLVGSQFLKKYEHRTYSSLRLTSHSYLRIRAIWDFALRMLEAASESPTRFAEVATAIFDAGPLPGARDILPSSNDPAELVEIGAELERCRLEPAFQALWPARSLLSKGIAWDEYWNRLNSEFLSQPIEPLEPLLGRYLLAVTDPVKLGRRLHEESGLERDEPVSIAGIVSDDDVFRSVQFDPVEEEYFVLRRDGCRRQVSWDEIRSACGFGGRPSGVLEYLLFAAFGSYLLVDPGDSVQPFHETIGRIHRRYTGLDFPWMTFEIAGPIADDANCFLEIYRPGFAETTVGILSRFLDR